MGSNSINFESPFPDLNKAFRGPFFAQDATIVINNGQITINKPLSLSPVFVIPNAPGPLPPINDKEAKLLALAQELGRQAKLLWDGVTTSRSLTQQLAGAVATMQVLSGLATMMSTRAQSAKKNASTIQKAKNLATAADALALKAARKLGKDVPNAENVEPGIESMVHDRYMALEDTLRHPASLQLWDDYWSDKTVPEERKDQFLYEFEEVLAFVMEVMSRSREHQKAAALALDSLDKPSSNLFGKVLGAVTKARSVYKSSVDIAITLGKCYATYWLPKAAVNKADAKSLENVLDRFLLKAMNLSKQEQSVFRDYYIRLANAQAKHAKAAQHEIAVRAKTGVSAEKLKEATDARIKAQHEIETESNRLRKFLTGIGDDREGVQVWGKFAKLQTGKAVTGFFTLVTILQLVTSFQQWDDPNTPTVQKCVDLTNASIGAGIAFISTVNKFAIPVDAIKTRLAYLDKLATSAKVATSIAVLGMISSGIQLGFAVFGKDEVDWKGVALSSAQLVSSGLLLLGVALTNPVLTAIGLLIGIALGVYALCDFFSNLFKEETEKAFKGIMDALKAKKFTWNTKPVLAALGCQGEFDSLKSAADEMDWFPIPVDYNKPKDEKDVREALSFLGFDKESIDKLIEQRPAPEVPYRYDFAPY